MLKKVQEDKATGLLVVPHWPTQPWWPYLANMLIAPPLILPRKKGHSTPTIEPRPSPPTIQGNKTSSVPFVWEHLTSKDLSTTASDVILQAWKTGTQKQYKSYLQRWELYCREQKINPVSASVIDGINFFGDLYQKKLSYSAINSACSALSTVIFPTEGGTFGNHPLVARFL